jgi:16S rRNA (cytidine1402-2'-O)-methyltransferase
MAGTLYLVATPIGNLQDITLRALETLKACDLVAAEDTRVTKGLLNHFGIQKPLASYFGGREKEKSTALLAALAEGKSLCLVTDAGTPGISDPGDWLVQQAQVRGIQVVPIPGPSALLAALTASGLPSQPFFFYGFLPTGNKERGAVLADLASLRSTLIFYEAPHRVKETLADLEAAFGDRPAAACRELTKLHEEIRPGNLSGLLAHFEAQSPRGEFTLVVGGNAQEPARDWEAWSVPEHLRRLQDSGKTLNSAISEVARVRSMDRKEVYRIGHGIGS